ncbi:MAG: hypothetical protein ACE5G9_03550 [Nitrospinales bacterium]
MAKTQSAKVLATQTEISLIDGIAVDQEGNVYISKRDMNVVSRIGRDGTIRPVAGSGVSGFTGDGGPALQAKLKLPAGLTFDRKGNLYIADRDNHRIRKVDTSGIITTVAGNGTPGFSGDGGPAIQASLNLPAGVAVDDRGRIFIADRSNDRIRMVDEKGIIHTYAGTGIAEYGGDGGPATKAHLRKPFGLALDKKQNLYIADRGNNRIRKVDASGIITSVAGDGSFFFIGDNGPAYRASLAGPTGVVVDEAGNIYVADRNNNRIRMIDANGLIRTVAGTGQQDYNGDGELARETNFYLPFAVALDNEGKLLVVDRSHYIIRRVNPQTGEVSTIAGNGLKKFRGDGGPATGASLNFPHGIVLDSKDNVYFSDKSNSRIRKITPDGIIDTVAGNGTRGTSGDGGPAMEAALFGPTSLAINSKDEIFFISQSGRTSVIRKIGTDGIITHFLGTTEKKFLKAVHFTQPLTQSTQFQFSDIAFDSQDNLYIADRVNHQIRKVDGEGNITTIAGTGEADFYGDGGPALKAAFYDPQALTVDKDGNIYIASAGSNRVRKIDTRGIVSTVAGNGSAEDSGDGGPATQAGIRTLEDVAISPSGELYIVEANGNRIRKVTREGIILTIAGRGVGGFFGDGGPAFKAMLKTPFAIAFDSKSNIYISDLGNNRIRKIDTKGIISTLAGSGTYGWADDGETVEIITQNFP